MKLTDPEKSLLKTIALEAIRFGAIHNHPPPPPRADDYSETLQTQAATFVTLLKYGQLRGCIGRLEAERPLVEDVASNAFSSAFHDTRFSPVSEDEIPDLDLKISILSPAVPMRFDSEPDLLASIREGGDGLILHEGTHRSVLLPSVWPQVSGPKEFLAILKRKAGLRPGYWSDSIRVERFSTVEF